ncbi:uncharacterized protein LOC117600089 [Osmia lignaria lignaria]|uniref:uncharacterized protein LOC117600089 n=1 Tax=Osmia lignaria lignaria TaxID=1437193 RepID=UPI00402B9FEC
MLTSTKPKTKYEQSVTPLTHPKNHFKLPSRKLWKEGISNSALKGDHWKKYRDSSKWDLVESPQFVDFSSAADVGDSYFDKVTVIVSTPNVNLQYGNLPNTFEGENSLIANMFRLMLEEEKKVKVFRANPLPKYLKSRVCKKLLGVPHITRKNLEKPKIPHLQTAIRAQLRKRFDDTIREKERQNEQLKQMEIAAKKKQEEEERLYLRKQTVHKPQPIRKYKLGLPNVAKRPLTDPVSPISLKRRRTEDRVRQNNFRTA